VTVRRFVGIDPGINGALALVALHESGIADLEQVVDTPTAEIKGKNHVLLPQVASILRDWGNAGANDAFIEDVHAMPGQGVVSMFRFGWATGGLEGVATGLGMSVQRLPPRVWQNTVFVAKDPDAGRLRAAQIFPDKASFFARKMDHNRADAVLIAYAGLKISNSK